MAYGAVHGKSVSDIVDLMVRFNDIKEKKAAEDLEEQKNRKPGDPAVKPAPAPVVVFTLKN